ncbi:MAG TPA: FtsX-like permease family protein [Puia sp.]|jgi:putative ABC transport system permease protein|nr:FtsX-like permease family protein [Puia sp.]
MTLMIGHYIKIAWRSLRKDGFFSAINVIGLALGLAVCLLIGMYLHDEWSYDTYNRQADRIFRVATDIHINGNSIHSVNTPSPFAAAMVRDFPAILSAVRIRRIPEVLVTADGRSFGETGAVLADPTLFDIFTIPMLAGDPHTALAEPNSIVIAENSARRYFGRTDVIGRTLQLATDSVSCRITGVIKDLPAESHFHFQLIKSLSGRKKEDLKYWAGLWSATYLLVRPDVTTGDIDRMLAIETNNYVDQALRQTMQNGLADLAQHGDYFRYYAMPLKDIHLHSQLLAEFEANGDSQRVNIFLAIAILILLIAGINFINLATARAARRFKEVGVRKILGSYRRQLMVRFLTEAMLMGGAATFLAFFLAIGLLPVFDRLTGSNFTPAVFFRFGWIAALVPAAVGVGLLAGIYPAFYLSGFKPLGLLKGDRLKSGAIRNGLVVFQFSAAILLISASGIVYAQLQYMRHRDLGYNREEVLTVHATQFMGDGARIFQQQVEQLPGVLSGTMTGFLPNTLHPGTRGFLRDASGQATATILMGDWRIDTGYVTTLGLTIVAGRNFLPGLATDSSGCLINETAARLLGYPNPVGHLIYAGDPLHILGVVRDFNAGSMHEKIEPIVFWLSRDSTAISFRIHTADLPGLIRQIRFRYEALAGAAAQPFSYTFLDEDFNNLYAADQRTGGLILALTIMALLIACLGLLGLVTYAAERRGKEIGIRKVLGAGNRQVMLLLSADFLRWILLAFVIACPLAWYCMKEWLQGFAYRTPVHWWIFLAAGLSCFGIAALTIGWQVLKAATANPVDRLRAE